MDAKVTAFSSTSAKKEQCFKLGAKGYVETGEQKDFFESDPARFDFILNCASSFTEINYSDYAKVLKVGATFTTVGATPVSEVLSSSPFKSF